MKILIPGKTFLVGEYLALAGGPSIVVNTTPCFEFSWEESYREASDSRGRVIQHPFHEASPAGRLLNQVTVPNRHSSKFAIQFRDPYQGKGGLGASTAEFAGAWIFQQMILNSNEALFDGPMVAELQGHREAVAPVWNSERVGSARFRDILDAYQATGAIGSGADLVSQVAGGFSVWDGRTDEMRKFRWPKQWSNQDLCLSLMLTGKKLATHEHLAALAAGTAATEASVNEEMRSWVEDAVQAFALEDADRLIASVRGFGKVLQDSGRIADHSRLLLEELADCSGVRAAKGCGAMGSDVLLILHDRSATAWLNEFRERNGLKLAATEAEVSNAGLSVQKALAPHQFQTT